jgi:hypothetical protein
MSINCMEDNVVTDNRCVIQPTTNSGFSPDKLFIIVAAFGGGGDT